MNRIRHLDTIITILFLTIVTTIFQAPTQAQIPQQMIFINGLIIDGTGASPYNNHVLVVEDDQIVGIFDSDDYTIPPEATVIDADGGTIMPGLFNAHVHDSASLTVRRRDFLSYGVTSICDAGSELSTIEYFTRTENRDGELVARGFRSGPFITAPDGYPDIYYQTEFNYEVEGVEEARFATEDLIQRGVDYIKIALEPGTAADNWAVLSEAEIEAIVTTAHDNNLLVIAHILQADMLDIALRQNIDVVHYVPFHEIAFDMNANAVREYLRGNVQSIQLPSAYVSQLLGMIQQDIILVPTMEVSVGWAVDVINPNDQAQVLVNIGMEFVRLYNAFGGQVAVGNAYNFLGNRAGIPLREMELLQASGMTPMEVIVASTRNSALSCGQGDRLGTLEAGKLADVIVVDGNPLDDLHALENIRFVVLGGQITVQNTP